LRSTVAGRRLAAVAELVAAALADGGHGDLALGQRAPLAVGAAQARPVVENHDELLVDDVPAVGV
jgi:hypothetical protein